MNKQELLDLCKVDIKKVDVEGYPKPLHIKALTIAQLLELQKLVREDDTGTKSFAFSVISSICDADGNPTFTEDDYDAIVSMDANKMAALTDAITSATSLQLDIEQAEKN